MPIFQVDIEKSFQLSNNTVYWTNSYHLSAADQAAANTAAGSIISAERALHLTGVTFTKYRVRQTDPLAASGSISTIGSAGTRTSGAYLPLFNVFRIDFNVGGGRPSRKYIRGPVLSGDNNNGAVTGTTVSGVLATYVSSILGVAGICDPQGQAFLSGTPYASIGMRQLRRGSKRRTTPVV